MNELLSRPIVLLLLSAAALIATVSFVSDIPDILTNKKNTDNSGSSQITTGSFSIIDKALIEKTTHVFFTFVGDFENPFRKNSGGETDDSNTPVIKPTEIERIKLQLKGILSKNKPLAILEDDRGMTYIRGVGDSVANQVIKEISGNNVTIVDKKGKYDITVEEQ